MKNKIKIYLAQRMTGQFCDDLLRIANEATVKLEQAGFTVLSPVIEEGVPNKHIRLTNTIGRLRGYWKRDKELLQECHIMLDLGSEGKSDGVNVEMGYTRFSLWKPLVRIHPNLGCTISRIEYDCVTDTLDKAITLMVSNWGTKRKLFFWRISMLNRCLPRMMKQQIQFLKDTII